MTAQIVLEALTTADLCSPCVADCPRCELRSSPPSALDEARGLAHSGPPIGEAGGYCSGPDTTNAARDEGDERVRVVVPDEPPRLSAQAAQALLRLLRNAAADRRQQAQPTHRDTEMEREREQEMPCEWGMTEGEE